MKSIRCAIYTRKSSEEGLEQDFNSLDAQYAACTAYVASQASEGWVLIKNRYDDGGISGGTLERPGLKALLADIAAGLIDNVVVYKVDRLTRSLLDFAKLVEAFDKAGVSFVSVTQSFNTTTSMGRLTLNMLLSFAQFEREVTAERIRDKIAASKQRGMWMGGTPPIGYRPDGRSLAIVEVDAAIVRHIFQRYLELGTVRALHDDLIRQRIRQPKRTTTVGRTFGGTSFGRGQLYNLLKNPLYIGRIRHGSKTYPGSHPAIIDQETWDRVQTQLADNSQGVQQAPTVKDPSLLAGKVVDHEGQPLVATHACKGKVRYRYYVSRHFQHGMSAANDAAATGANGVRVPAKELEQLVIKALVAELKDPIALARKLGASIDGPRVVASLVNNAAAMVAILDGKRGPPVQVLLQPIVQRVAVQDDVVELAFEPAALAHALGVEAGTSAAEPMTIAIPARIRRTGMAVRFVLETGQHAAAGAVDQKLVTAIAKARVWWKKLEADTTMTVTDLAKAEGLAPNFVDRVLRLAFLSPAVVNAVLDGTAPTDINLERLKDVKLIAPSWAKQHSLLGVDADQR
jgi:DNA invertase Pin-like site-specific DNA recombinase